MSHHGRSSTYRCGPKHMTTNVKTPFRVNNEMAPPATTIRPRADLPAVTPNSPRIYQRSLSSNVGISQRELKRSRVVSNSDAFTGNNYHSEQPTLPHRPSSHSGYNESSTLCASKNNDDSSSLANLASRFSILLNSKGDEELDLNEAVQHLDVPKRRIYDITCVMEGCGMIEKRNKNKVVNCCEESESEVFQKKNLENDIRDLKEHEQSLDDYIDCLQKEVKQYTLFNESDSLTSNLFVTKREVASIENYSNDTVLAIRAPPKTSVYVPLPDQVRKPGMRKFQIQLTCPDKNSVYIHEVKCGNKRERPSNLARSTMHHRQVGGTSQIRPSQYRRNLQNSNNMPSRCEMPNYPNQMQRSLGQSNIWAKNRGNNYYPLQEQRKTERIQPELHPQETLSHSVAPTNNKANRATSRFIPPKNHMHPPQLPPKDSYMKHPRFIRPPIERNNECADTPSLKRKRKCIGLRPISRSTKRDGRLEADSYAGRKNNSLINQPLLLPMASDAATDSSSLPTHNEVGKCSSNSLRPTSSCGYLSPGATRKQLETTRYKGNYVTKPLHDTRMCGPSPSPNTRDFELLNAPLDSPLQASPLQASPLQASPLQASPLQASPRPFRHSGRASADGCGQHFYSPPLNGALILSPFASTIEGYTAEETTPNFFSISPMSRAV